EISFDQPLVDRWIKASLDLSQDQFVALGARLAESYARRLTEALSAEEDPLDLCAEYGWDLKGCRYRLEQDTKSAMRLMWVSLRAMNDLRQEREKFVRAFAEFGEAFSKSVFAFQAALDLLGSGVPATLEVGGTHLSQLRLKLVTGQGGEFKFASKP
ncbi:MAG: hypothetical protein AB7K41_01140, partial [Bdellovibrionales bacterium]